LWLIHILEVLLDYYISRYILIQGQMFFFWSHHQNALEIIFSLFRVKNMQINAGLSISFTFSLSFASIYSYFYLTFHINLLRCNAFDDEMLWIITSVISSKYSFLQMVGNSWLINHPIEWLQRLVRMMTSIFLR